ncbi:hypothetical protein QJS10_CPB14g00398 [Acorus calamus]|uniref:Uncharacterized protein n=1 Tax=Acorus calamus TaxID=4465 RepID=A0AAV9DAK9_ACOCL|nr:hypothetical protein QJS10_CPB14g00398 [Acorus calamus]
MENLATLIGSRPPSRNLLHLDDRGPSNCLNKCRQRPSRKGHGVDSHRNRRRSDLYHLHHHRRLSNPPKRPNLRRRSSEPPPTQNQQQQQPSVAEIQRAITSDGSKTTGAGKFGASSGGEGRSSAFMDLLASTPIGMPESSIERKLRETGEWIIDQTEGKDRPE